MDHEEIKQSFSDAGWGLDGSFEDHLIIGHGGDRISILAHKEAWGTEEPSFELLDHETMLTYWVNSGRIPSPEQARMLLEEHGQPQEVAEHP